MNGGEKESSKRLSDQGVCREYKRSLEEFFWIHDVRKIGAEGAKFMFRDDLVKSSGSTYGVVKVSG